MKRRVTQADVAARAGVHVTTVSLALRRSPSLPAETAERLRALAQEMGYRRDPVLDALCAYRTAATARRRAFGGVLAWLDGYGSPEISGPTGLLRPAEEAARARALEHGYRLESFRYQPENAARLGRILVHRGVQGVIVPPMPGGGAVVELPWEKFSAVAISRGVLRPRLHLFSHDHGANLRVILRALEARGRRRPGLLLGEHEHARTGGERCGAFLQEQFARPEAERVPPIVVEQPTREVVREYWIRHRLDALIVNRVGEEPGWLRDLPRAEGGVVAATVDGGAHSAGLREDVGGLMARAVDFLVGSIQRRERGEPERRVRVLVTGTWTDGAAALAL
jgi:LacI family repressor for deo operon, udp, cdd, tsx, nupC, and nupG